MHVISSGFELVNRVLMFDIRKIFIIHLQNNIMKSEKKSKTTSLFLFLTLKFLL